MAHHITDRIHHLGGELAACLHLDGDGRLGLHHVILENKAGIAPLRDVDLRLLDAVHHAHRGAEAVLKLKKLQRRAVGFGSQHPHIVEVSPVVESGVGVALHINGAPQTVRLGLPDKDRIVVLNPVIGIAVLVQIGQDRGHVL